MSTTMLASYSTCLAASFISYIGVKSVVVGQADDIPAVGLLNAAEGLEGPMLFAFLMIVAVLWFLRGQSSEFSAALKEAVKTGSDSSEKSAQTNKEALQHVTTGLAAIKTELGSDLDGIKTKQDEHTKELGLHRSEITKLAERIPSTCKIKDDN